jgi:hypothetical protein
LSFGGSIIPSAIIVCLMATTEMAGYAEFGDLDVKAQEEQH